ncbi:Uncharacterised protein [uncultured archaeon]|nr:Uncharacterised protein [uncultured archaeon]
MLWAVEDAKTDFSGVCERIHWPAARSAFERPTHPEVTKKMDARRGEMQQIAISGSRAHLWTHESVIPARMEENTAMHMKNFPMSHCVLEKVAMFGRMKMARQAIARKPAFHKSFFWERRIGIAGSARRTARPRFAA